MKETKRYIARFIVETNTPMAIGSGEKGLIVDRLIAIDANGLPYIPGTSLAGVIRHELSVSGITIDNLFGTHDTDNGQGSRINFSSAILLAEDGKTVLEGLHNLNFSEGYYSYFKRLPERDHVRITHKGSADTEGYGKFDEQLVQKGVRFVFEIEIEGTDSDQENWDRILSILHNPSFRIGAGTRKGFGQLNVIECKTRVFDLQKQLEQYLDTVSSLNKDTQEWTIWNNPKIDLHGKQYFHYKVSLEPENFYMFGAGIGDNDVDMAPKSEKYFEWSTGKPVLSTDKILIPATSIKGALSHRVAYHYNRLNNITVELNEVSFQKAPKEDILDSLKALEQLKVDIAKTESNLTIEDTSEIDRLVQSKSTLEASKNKINELTRKLREIDPVLLIETSHKWKNYQEELNAELSRVKRLNPNVAELNEAVRELFGYSKDSSKKDGLRGRIIFSDVYLDKKRDVVTEKIFDHVAIDRFTGGGINGALYQEKVINSSAFKLDLFVEKDAFKNELIKEAFENSLSDLVNGNLSLGGNTGKGHGSFMGKFQLVN